MLAFNSLVAALFRRVNRRVLNFPVHPANPRLPAPEADRRYLLYLHVPYCVVLCPFCSFHRVRFKEDSARRYFDCLRREIDIVSRAGYTFGELYVGGGTPTVIPGELTRTIAFLRDRHPLDAISVETNPDDLEKDSVQRLRDAGVNRLSVGVQSFDDALLAEMQRLDKYGSGAEIVRRLLRASGCFDTLNVDMIFNFPHQTEQSLLRDLDLLVDEVGVDQVSWYPLMAATSTRRSMAEKMGEVDFSRERQLYELIVDRMLTAGYQRNSAWCFSRTPAMFDEYIVEHEEYVGLGSGAFSYLQGGLYASTFSINHYLRLVEAGETGTTRRRVMSRRDRMRYYLLMRLFAGSLDLDAAESRFGGRFGKTLWPELAALRAMRAIRMDDGRLSLSDSGYYLWVSTMREFFTAVSDLRDDMRHHIAEEYGTLPPPAAKAGFGKPQ